MLVSQKMADFGRGIEGLIYDLGDHGPPSNRWDCSGETMEMVKDAAGLDWPHSSHWQYVNGIKSGGDLPDNGPISSIPTNKSCFLFKYGKRTNGEMGMIHVGYYDAETKMQMQAGGNGPKVELEVYEKNIAAGMLPKEAAAASLWTSKSTGTKKSIVSVEPLTASYWSYWGRGPWMDVEVGTQAETQLETLRKGDHGDLVAVLQRVLNRWNATLQKPAFTALVVDGEFGTLTYQAVREYQERLNLFVDGIVGPETWGSFGTESLDTEYPDPLPEYTWQFNATEEDAALVAAQFPMIMFIKQS